MNSLSPGPIISVIIGYFLVLIGISYLSAGKGDNKTFFSANKNSPWYLVAFGMVGASLSGVTFISIPGVVGKEAGANINFSYMQLVLGYILGYIFIAKVLLPIYYKHNVTSIYSYLDEKLGFGAYKSGAALFLVSRIIGASFRLFLVAMVMDLFVTGPMGLSFPATVFITILLIWVYTFKGGIKTIVITDTFQTASMLLAVVLTIAGIIKGLNTDLSGIVDLIKSEGYTKTFYFSGGWSDPNNFFKQFFGGALLTIVMTGLDQDMMQKNLTCRTLKDAQKNMISLSIVLVFVNILFLSLGAMMYIYASQNGIEIPESRDQLYPLLALNYLGPAVGIFFVLGLIAAAYSSADSALTSLTTSFCIDFLGMDPEEQSQSNNTRLIVHVGFSLVLFVTIILFNLLNGGESLINSLFTISGYTYGPILGLFTFAILMKNRDMNHFGVIGVCIVAPILTYFLDMYSEELLLGFKFGFLALLLNGILSFAGFFIFSSKIAK